MSDSKLSHDLFFEQNDLDRSRIFGIVDEELAGADDGELYLEYCQSEGFSFDDGRLKNATFDTSQGFGFRAIAGEATGYAHASEVSEAAIKRAGASIQAAKGNYSGTSDVTPPGTNEALYVADNPLNDHAFETKVQTLQAIDAYARSKDPRVRQVSCSLAGEWSAVEILRVGEQSIRDIRPLVRLNVSVVVGDGDRQESGSYGAGGRTGYDAYLDPNQWQGYVDEAIRQALLNLEAEPAPAGEMQVVLGPGWPGILLHEAIGHGLEGDFNRKGTSAFANLMGERVAAPGVTVVDDGSIRDRRGSLTVDDEGTPSQNTVLIEDGILKGFMHDRLNARLMGMSPTGNGRRQSFAHMPMPRMTNTYMHAGQHEPEEILKSVKDGIYAVNFGGGQVDITNGKFVFSCTEAYRIRDGKIGAPVKDATLIGNGPDVLTKVGMIGNDMKLDPGIGTCGKQGQGVPVGVGQPTLLINGVTIGGTST
jgi:TldD protein